MKRLILFIAVAAVLAAGWLFTAVKRPAPMNTERVQFDVPTDATAHDVAELLKTMGAIQSTRVFEAYLRLRRLDTRITPGVYVVAVPITIERIADALSRPGQGERTITIIPGWTIRDVSEYFEKEGIIASGEFFQLVGTPAKKNSEFRILNSELPIVKMKPANLSLEGYLAPQTYRVFKTATAEEIVKKLIDYRAGELADGMIQDIASQEKTVHEILTMASILEKEVRKKEDKEMVSDIFWRRIARGWALQADSTVHYAVGGSGGSVYTSAGDRSVDSPWNTYKYPGLPPGPISNPGMESILAAIRPKKNVFWYFLTDKDGAVHYAKTLDEHNANRGTYLR